MGYTTQLRRILNMIRLWHRLVNMDHGRLTHKYLCGILIHTNVEAGHIV